MHILLGIVSLSFLVLLQPASAQTTKSERIYSLTVGHHRDIKLTATTVDKILAEASKVLKQCNVTFRRKGDVLPFANSNTPKAIDTSDHRDDVHSEKFDIKIVETIGFCREENQHLGCAWDPPAKAKKPEKPQKRSMIVVEPNVSSPDFPKVTGILWAHEFGHRTGLWHRKGKKALMTPCSVESGNVEITARECRCFHGGPGFCTHRERKRPAECS